MPSIRERRCHQSRCHQYVKRKKSNKFFLDLEKVWSSRGNSVNLLQGTTSFLTPKNWAWDFKIFENNVKKTLWKQANFLDTLQILTLSDEKYLLCEGELIESELYDALKNMPNNKFLGNDGLTKELFLSFLGDKRYKRYLNKFYLDCWY